LIQSEISGSHGDEYEPCSVVDTDHVPEELSASIFRVITMVMEAVSSSETRSVYTALHGATSQKTDNFN
jgi:hypothetical protein